MKTDDSREASQENYLSWEAAVPLATNRFLLYDYWTFIALAWLILTLVLASALYLLTPATEVLTFWGLFVYAGYGVGLVLLTIFAFFLVASLLFLRNRFFVRYVINGQGVSYETCSGASADAGAEAKTLKRYLSLKPWLIEEGVLRKWKLVKWIRWTQVDRLVFHPRTGVLTLSGGLLPILRLYVGDPNLYQKVSQVVNQEFTKAADS